MKKIPLFILMAVALAPFVIAPPLSLWGFVYQDYSSLHANVSVFVYGDCYGTGRELIANTTTGSATGYYQVYIPMDEPTPPGPAGVDEGCSSADQLDFEIQGNYSYSPEVGVWTIADFVANPLNLLVTGPFVLQLPANSSTTTNRTPFFSWIHGNNSNFSYNLIIDDETSFSSPLVQNISNITSLNYTLSNLENLTTDDRYYWKIDALLDGVANGSSSWFYFDLDTTPAFINYAVPTNNSWNTSLNVDLLVVTDEAGYCRWDRLPGVAFNTKSALMTGSGTSHSDTVSLLSQGNNSIYIQCNDSLGNVMPLADEYHLNIRYDSLAPNTSVANVSIDSGSTHSNDTTLDVEWSGFSDFLCPTNCSGISSYTYNTINNFATGTVGTSPVVIAGVPQGTVNVYVWATDVAGNTAGPISDSIVVDTNPPVFGSWTQTPSLMNDSHVGNITITVDVTDAVAGINSHIPKYSYIRGTADASWTTYQNMSFLGGSTYSFEIPPPALGWSAISDQKVKYTAWALDLLNNSANSSVYSINVTRENYEPVWIQPTDQTLNEDNAWSMIISGSDNDKDTLTFTTNMSNLTITSYNRSSANVSWTPTNGNVGTHQVYFTVTDSYAPVNSSTITLTVVNTNDPPVFPTINDQSGYEHEEFFLDASATDEDVGDIITYSDNVDIFDIGTTTGYINFTPLQSARGEHNITITADDATTTRNVNFTLTVYYCGDNVCNVNEGCGNCSADCGVCGAETTDQLAIVLQDRNCLDFEFPIKVYQLYTRATCDTMGQIVDGYEVCGNLSDVDLEIYLENPGSFEDEEDEWNLTGEYVTDEFGETSFIPTKTGKYKISARKSGYPDTDEYAEVNACWKDEVEENATQGDDIDLEPLEPDTEEPETPVVPEEEEPTILTEEEGSLMLFVIFYMLIPLLFLSLFSAVTYWYHVEKDNNKSLLRMRIWWKKHWKLLKLYIEYYYHQIKGKLGGKK